MQVASFYVVLESISLETAFAINRQIAAHTQCKPITVVVPARIEAELAQKAWGTRSS